MGAANCRVTEANCGEKLKNGSRSDSRRSVGFV